MTRMNARRAAMLIVALSLGGCATAFNLAGSNAYHPEHEAGPPHPEAYGGVRSVVNFLQCKAPHGHPAEASYVLGLFVDLPLSFGMDTLLLPVTLLFEIFGEGPAADRPPGGGEEGRPRATSTSPRTR